MGVTPTSCQFIHPHIMVPILQSPGLPERAGEARRADSASYYNVIINTSSYADPIGQNMQTNAKNCLFCMPDELATECMTFLMSNN